MVTLPTAYTELVHRITVRFNAADCEEYPIPICCAKKIMTQRLCMSRNVGNSLLVLKAENIISMNFFHDHRVREGRVAPSRVDSSLKLQLA